MKYWMNAALMLGLGLGCNSHKTAASSTEPEVTAVPKAQTAAPVPVAKQGETPWWSSVDACRSSIDSARRARLKVRGVRLGNWNVKYFPDHVGPGKDVDPEHDTDIAWLACGIAQLGVDILAVQEFKANPRAKQAADNLLTQLAKLTGSTWKLKLSECGPPDVSHTGLLWNTKRVRAQGFQEHDALLLGHRCDDDWQHVLAGTFVERRGGAPFTFAALHLVAGDEHGAYQNRRKQVAQVSQLFGRLGQGNPSRVIVTGDWNTSGCTNCEPKVSSAQEVEQTFAAATTKAGFRLLQSAGKCSFYQGNEPVLLDHFAVAASMKDGSELRATVGGYCAGSNCEEDEEDAPIRAAVSDHCPVWIELPPSRG